MHVRFWGTRGSLPSSLTARQVRTKLVRAIGSARGRDLATAEAIEAFLDHELPFSVSGTYGGNTPCVEIGDQPDYLICDAGTGLRDFGNGWLRSARGTAPAVFHLFLSHLHWDHIQGFPFFVPAYRGGNTVHVYSCHPDAEKALVNQQAAPYFPVPFAELGAKILFHTLEPGRSYELAGYCVRAIAQNHPGDSYGYSFIREGRKFVYSTDMEHGPEAQNQGYAFVDFYRGADLLVCDAQYSLADAIGSKETWGHSSNVLAVELAVQAGVKRLCLFHTEPTRDDEALDRFLDETREYLKIYDPGSPLTIALARDGLEMIL